MSTDTSISSLTDNELLALIKKDIKNLDIIYHRCKTGCINFMRNKFSDYSSKVDFEDIYHEAHLVLMRKIDEGGFSLTATFQTYLISICKNQCRNTVKNIKKTEPLQVLCVLKTERLRVLVLSYHYWHNQTFKLNASFIY